MVRVVMMAQDEKLQSQKDSSEGQSLLWLSSTWSKSPRSSLWELKVFFFPFLIVLKRHTCVIHVFYYILKHSYVYMFFSNYYSRLKKIMLGRIGENRFGGWLDPIPLKVFQQTETQRFLFLSKPCPTLLNLPSLLRPITAHPIPWVCLCHPRKVYAFNEVLTP